MTGCVGCGAELPYRLEALTSIIPISVPSLFDHALATFLKRSNTDRNGADHRSHSGVCPKVAKKGGKE